MNCTHKGGVLYYKLAALNGILGVLQNYPGWVCSELFLGSLSGVEGKKRGRVEFYLYKLF